MNFRAFATQVLFRFTAILLILVVLAYLATATDMKSPLLVLALLAAGVAVSLFHYINRTNKELARFLNAIRYEDFLQSFSIDHLGTGFPELNEAFKKLIEGFRDARSKKEQQARYLETLVEHMPMPLVAVYEGESIELRNNAARRLFNKPRHVKEADLEEYGNLFLRDLMQARAGETRTTRINIGGNEQQFIMSTTQITVDGKAQRILSLVDIQTHLDSTELAAWQDLVRVVSHEILNSVTPIASLARTADEMVEELKVSVEDEEKLGDVRNAVQTLARRSEGLTRFVQSYKRLTQMAPPKQTRVQLNDYLDRLARLMKAELAGRKIEFKLEEVSGNPQIRADEDLLDQALINLIQNAADALTNVTDPQITVRAWLNERGRAVIEVEDNGPGVNPEIADRIFLPFFSTKQEGSGIGLALTRQIVMVHGGALVLMPDREQGACFRLTL